MGKQFQNREEAGKQLAEKLSKYIDQPIMLLGIPRGGIPVAAEIAKTLHCKLDVLLCKKIGHPGQKEYAIGAVGLNDSYLIPHEHVDQAYIISEMKVVRQRLEEMKHLYSLADQRSFNKKIVIVVDDGMATGRTMMVAIRLIRKSNPEKIILAVPVASSSSISLIRPETDELIVLHEPYWFSGVGAFYEEFEAVSDDEVIDILKRTNQSFKTLSS
jgi:predicted phosphoribosyltransferase